MKIDIKDYCIRCGICVGLYPELYVHNFEDDKIDILMDPETPEQIERAKSSAADCAVTAIFLSVE